MGFDSTAFSTVKAQGYLTAIFAADVAIVLMVIYLFMFVFSPNFGMYKRWKKLDEIAGPTKRHWIFGHDKEV